MKRHISYAISILFLYYPAAVLADTVSFKDGKEEKGIVVEEYFDRIVLSTVDGEVTRKKADIKDISYDRQEQNLVKLGDYCLQKNNLVTAYEYFRKAYQLNPDYKEAQEKYIHIRSVLMMRPQRLLDDDMERRRSLFKEAGRVYSPKIIEGIPITLEDKLKKTTGLVLVSENEMPRVSAVIADSPAQKAHIAEGDYIYAIWGRLTGYLALDVICNDMMESPSAEIIITLKRTIEITTISNGDKKYSGLAETGLSLDMKEAGLTVSAVKENSVAAKRGLLEGDLIISISGRPTRYMPLKEAKSLIETSCSNGYLELEVLRTTILWRKEL